MTSLSRKENVKMKILWASKNRMTTDQYSSLTKIYDNPKIVRAENNITNVNELLSYEPDVFAVVLPTDTLAELVSRTSKDVIRPVEKKVRPDGTVIPPEEEAAATDYTIKHFGFEKVLKIEIKTKML